MPSYASLFPDHHRRTLIMGVVNVTPDSFSDGGLFHDAKQAVAHALQLAEEGADMLDVGGESTRPHHEPVLASEEQKRIIPVIEALAGQTRVPISVDTYKASTALKAIEAGAKIINDVWGLQKDPEMANVVASHKVPLIMMHNRETIDPQLNVWDDIQRFFERSLLIADKAKINRDQLVLDPGIGFGKTAEQSLAALKNITRLRGLGFPVLVGASRKSLIGRYYPQGSTPRDRIFGSLAAHILAVHMGANVIRAHDVKAHVEACRVADGIVHDHL
jgi:dihydropteroate synthase